LRDNVLIDILRERPGRRYTSSELAELLGITGGIEHTRRIIHKLVQKLRMTGSPICSASDKDGGYWWPTDREDAQNGFEIQHKRVVSQLTTLSKWKAAIDECFPPKVRQEEMFITKGIDYD